MKSLGHEVSGSDKGSSQTTLDLISQGVPVTQNQDGTGLPSSLDLLVYSEAIPESARERQAAARMGVRQISYFAALGELTAGRELICIAGTHGKSSTTAMTAKVFIDAGMDPNVVVGTKMQELGGRNWRASRSKLWIVEACEYRRSFLHLSPRVILLTNADGDHFDAFKDMNDYESAFISFIQKLPAQGDVISHGNISTLRSIVSRAGRRFIDADNEPLTQLGTPGVHMQQNAQLVLKLAKLYGISKDAARRSLAEFNGTWRRLETKGTTHDKVLVIDDYAHHPTEIKASLAALRAAYPERRIICAFQPHTHDRTLKLWDAFLSSFADADIVVVTDVYDARPDKDSAKVDLAAFLKGIREYSHCQVIDGESLVGTKAVLIQEILRPSDVLITMGAGSITNLATDILRDS
jgi:UDP-N-acetylmuramate--alanine ligase